LAKGRDNGCNRVAVCNAIARFLRNISETGFSDGVPGLIMRVLQRKEFSEIRIRLGAQQNIKK